MNQQDWRSLYNSWYETETDGEHDYHNVEPEKFATPAINGGEFCLYADAATKEEWIMGDSVEIKE